MILKSHRDQKCRPYAVKALENSCNLLEIDVQLAMGRVVLGHNWRPKLPCLFDCTLKDYLVRVENNVVKSPVFIQLDIKEVLFTSKGRINFANKIASVILSTGVNVVFLVSGNEGLFRKMTAETVIKVLEVFHIPVFSYNEWEKTENIKTIDLW